MKSKFLYVEHSSFSHSEGIGFLDCARIPLKHRVEVLFGLKSALKHDFKLPKGPFFLDYEQLCDFGLESSRSLRSELHAEHRVEPPYYVVSLVDVGVVLNRWYQNAVPAQFTELAAEAFEDLASFRLLLASQSLQLITC